MLQDTQPTYSEDHQKTMGTLSAISAIDVTFLLRISQGPFSLRPHYMKTENVIGQ
jgi:hypothetical protein